MPNSCWKSTKSVAAVLRLTDTMPLDRTSFQQPFNPNLLEPAELITPGGLKTALSSIERVCYYDDYSITEMVGELSSRPYIFEYIISSMLRTLLNPLDTVEKCSFSIGRSALREGIQMAHRPIPHSRHTQHGGGFGDQTPSAAILFSSACRRGGFYRTP